MEKFIDANIALQQFKQNLAALADEHPYLSFSLVIKKECFELCLYWNGWIYEHRKTGMGVTQFEKKVKISSNSQPEKLEKLLRKVSKMDYWGNKIASEKEEQINQLKNRIFDIVTLYPCSLLANITQNTPLNKKGNPFIKWSFRNPNDLLTLQETPMVPTKKIRI